MADVEVMPVVDRVYEGTGGEENVAVNVEVNVASGASGARAKYWETSASPKTSQTISTTESGQIVYHLANSILVTAVLACILK